jgi:hypothetical protein
MALKKQFQQNKNSKKHVCKIVYMALDILVGIVKAKDRTKDLPYTTFKFFIVGIIINYTC